jgi:hypothetical protein
MQLFKKSILILAILISIVSCNSSNKKKSEGSLLQSEFKIIQDYLKGSNYIIQKHFNKDGVKDSLIVNKPDWESEMLFFKSMDIPAKKINTYTKTNFTRGNKTNVLYKSKDETNMVQMVNVLYVNDTVQKVAIKYVEKKDLYKIIYLVELDKNVGYLIEAQHDIQMMYNNTFRIECLFK